MKDLIAVLFGLLLMTALPAHAQFDYVTNADDVSLTITGYFGQDGVVNIPSNINGLPVTIIADDVFDGNSNVTSVTIPNGVISIGDHAFADTGLADINMPSSVFSIGNYAFSACDNLTNAIIGAGVTNLGEGSFWLCPALRQVMIPTSVATIGAFAFQDCLQLKNVYFAGNAPFVREDVFYNDKDVQVNYVPCASGWSNTFAGLLTVEMTPPSQFSCTVYSNTVTINFYSGTCPDVIIPAVIDGLSVTSIGAFAFYGTVVGVTHVVIPVGVTDIGAAAFMGSPLINPVIVPDSITSIGMDAFRNCDYITNFIIPGSVTNIGEDPLGGCSSLQTIMVDPTNAFYSNVNGVLFDKSETTLVQFPGGISGDYAIPDGTAAIAYDAFDSCPISNITIPSSVTNIDDWAFYLCTNLTSVIIPSSVANMGIGAFFDCWSLAMVLFEGNAPTVSIVTFADDPATVYYLPNTSGWSPAFWGYPSTGPEAVLWNPSIQINDGNLGIQNGLFGFDVAGASNIPVMVEACTNLANPIWTPLTNVTLTNGLFYFSDPQWTNYAARFYGLGFP